MAVAALPAGRTAHEPEAALYVGTADSIDFFLLELAHFLRLNIAPEPAQLVNVQSAGEIEEAISDKTLERIASLTSIDRILYADLY